MRGILLGGVLGLLGVGAACGADDDGGRSAKDIVRERFPECAGRIGDSNPTVREGVIQFDCGSEIDGPIYYLDAFSGALICQCSMLCDPDCPPPPFAR
jgi:hypothetical protein